MCRLEPACLRAATGRRHSFDPVRRTRLLNGWGRHRHDLTATGTVSYQDRIAAFKAKDRDERPWATPQEFNSQSIGTRRLFGAGRHRSTRARLAPPAALVRMSALN